jgi:molybdopterin-guanine dinucleotide biosynthesis protein A
MIAVIFVKKSERFPDKHSIRIGGTGMTEGIHRKLTASGMFQDILILSKDPDLRTEHGKIIRDPTNGTILDSVSYAVRKFGDIFAFGGDMPFLCTDFISSMISQFNGRTMCPISPGGIRQTLHCIYAQNDSEHLEEYIASGGKTLHEFVEKFGVSIPYPAEKEICFENVNYRSDLRRLGIE